MTRLTTRGRATAQAIAEHKPFTTSGALEGVVGGGYGTGRLNDYWRDLYLSDHYSHAGIVYTVYSYATPIAWVTGNGEVRKVSQRFSVTTTKHQGNLYML